MANQYVNKVQKSDGTTLIDISDSTAVASDVASGKYFYLASGEKVAGTASGGGDYEMGTFTPSAETNTITVSVSKLYSHFAIWTSDTLANTTAVTSGRLLVFAHGDGTSYTVVDANTSKSGFYIIDRTGYDTWRSYIQFSASQIKAMFLGNGAATRMASGQSYTWIAW